MLANRKDRNIEQHIFELRQMETKEILRIVTIWRAMGVQSFGCFIGNHRHGSKASVFT